MIKKINKKYTLTCINDKKINKTYTLTCINDNLQKIKKYNLKISWLNAFFAYRKYLVDC